MPNRITVLDGDYIGPEIMKAGLQVLAAVTKDSDFEYQITHAPFGGQAIDEVGEPLPQTTVDECKNSDAVLLSAIGGPKWDQCPKRPEQGLLAIRKALNLFANIRPTKISKAMMEYSPLKKISPVDFVIVRELTSGIYFGEPREKNADDAFDTMRYTKNEIKRVTKIAFEMAQGRNHKVTLVDKSNVLATSKFWREIVGEMAKQYPDVEVDYCYVDAAAMKIISNPAQFDVILTENLFGDILSDEAAQITGSLGTIPSMSKGDGQVALYEPIHGSAPDIAGKGIANPFSMINSVAMMLENSFGRKDLAIRIEDAVNQAVAAKVVTPDLGGNYQTQAVTNAVIQNIERVGVACQKQ
ncbi:3-isopropylmalate dehydrogenase [Lactobacillus sp. Sy-1]|uniref:3-isopropylmalate dehydrogenase n=1 Tax=Lactobacillus sp. Sy-1 TaxID=2109645 RepID=UPI001C5B42BF|nr:3-isopropylmalate dehydrogenase [Lactobacillus sp. Sy-1]MBW1606154.1 3-isopropylmalate dehydrogenase [Lactobacillus sp. Sy-1]